jgi:hypothetical protein
MPKQDLLVLAICAWLGQTTSMKKKKNLITRVVRGGTHVTCTVKEGGKRRRA